MDHAHHPASQQEADEHLARLQTWRQRKYRESSLTFIREQFKHTIEKPYKQLGDLVAIWENTIPPALCDQTALKSMRRGTLTVIVASSSTLYELDRQLRSGLEQQIRQQFKGNRLRIKLEVGQITPEEK